MKLIQGILLFPAFLAAVLSGMLGLIYYGCGGLDLAHQETAGGHLLAAFLYLAVGTGLPLAIFAALCGAVLGVAGFILKSWSRGLTALAVSAGGTALWIYFVTVDFF